MNHLKDRIERLNKIASPQTYTIVRQYNNVYLYYEGAIIIVTRRVGEMVDVINALLYVLQRTLASLRVR